MVRRRCPKSSTSTERCLHLSFAFIGSPEAQPMPEVISHLPIAPVAFWATS